MKISVVMAAALLMVSATGCRYNKAGSGAGNGAGFNDDNGGVSNIAGIEDYNDNQLAVTNSELDRPEELVDMSEGGSLSDISEQRFEDCCTRCSDVNFAPVYFGFDSQLVPQSELNKVDAVADYLRENGNLVVVIEGNCDERGSNEYNMSLGEGRAIYLRNYLVQCGVSMDRIQTRSFGEEKPVAAGHDESAWSMNRRGDFVIYRR